MAEYKYGTNFTSVKVKYAPGGYSSINLGWDDAKPPISRNELKNTEKRNAIQDPFKSREGLKNLNQIDELNQYDKFSRNPQNNQVFSNFRENPSNFRENPQNFRENPQNFRENPQNYAKSPFLSKPQDSNSSPQSSGGNYYQPKEDSSIPPEFRLPQNYFKPPEPSNNYFQAKGYQRNEGLVGSYAKEPLNQGNH